MIACLSSFIEQTHSSNQNLTGQVGTQLYASPEQASILAASQVRVTAKALGTRLVYYPYRTCRTNLDCLFFPQETGTNYCFLADMFSLGIIFFELFHVFDTQMERLEVCSFIIFHVVTFLAPSNQGDQC